MLSSSSGGRICAAVSSADRARRARDAWVSVRNAAPIVAVAGAAGCLAARAAGASAMWVAASVVVPVGVLIAIAGIVYRPRGISDLTASRADDDAGLRGELRSAHWFAAREPVDEWTAWHRDHAAVAVERVTWTNVYPRPRLRVSMVATILLLLAALIVPLHRSGRVAVQAAPAVGVLSLDELE